MAGEFTDLRLGHVAKRKHRAAELILRQAEQEISLVFTCVGGTLEEPAAPGFIKGHARVVTGGNTLSPNLLSHNEQLIKLQVIVAETAGDGRPTRNVLLHER